LQIYIEPVDTTEVPDYRDVVTIPMDLGTMRLKLDSTLRSRILNPTSTELQNTLQVVVRHRNKHVASNKSTLMAH
jgi:hypothetical protein